MFFRYHYYHMDFKSSVIFEAIGTVIKKYYFISKRNLMNVSSDEFIRIVDSFFSGKWPSKWGHEVYKGNKLP